VCYIIDKKFKEIESVIEKRMYVLITKKKQQQYLV